MDGNTCKTERRIGAEQKKDKSRMGEDKEKSRRSTSEEQEDTYDIKNYEL